MSPRFLLVAGHRRRGRLTPSWPGNGRVAQPILAQRSWMAWRLVGGNHWELARSAAVFATPGQVSSAIQRLRRNVDRARVDLDVAGRVWSWRLSVDGELVAVAGRVYQRKQTCAQAAAASLAAIPAAQLAGVLRQCQRRSRGVAEGL